MPVLGENVVSGHHPGVARESALGVVPLRRLASHGAGREGVGRGVIVEHGVAPSAAVGESCRHGVAVLESHGLYTRGSARHSHSATKFQVRILRKKLSE